MSYDNRMTFWDNWRFKMWRPFLCWSKGHDFSCYGLTPGRGIISGYFLICHRCTYMSPDGSELPEPCGFATCQNTCKGGRNVEEEEEED